jgi:hypothetical protein
MHIHGYHQCGRIGREEKALWKAMDGSKSLDLNMCIGIVLGMSVAAESRDSSPEDVEKIGEEIATFAARVDVAEHALISRLRVFDAHEGWGSSFASCAHWLSWRTGVGIKAAREKVRVARALGELEKVDALFGRGELSYSKVRAITRVATPKSEQDFIDIAMHATASQTERLCRAYERTRTDLGKAGEPAPSQSRLMRRSETLGGMVHIEIRLPPEEAAVVWDAMTSALDADARSEPAGDSAESSSLAEGPTSGAEDSAESSSPVEGPVPGTQDSAESSAPSANDPVASEERRADAIVDVARAYLEHRPRTLGSGYELVVITTPEQLEHGREGVGGHLRDGTPVPLHVARMLACDGKRIDVVMGKDGELLDVGRTTRSIPSAIGRALWLRDGGCRVPGCGCKTHLQGHHIEWWTEGGVKLSNLVLLCRRHHRLIHEGKLSIEVRANRLLFLDDKGRVIPNAPAAAATGQDLEELERFLRDADLDIDASTNFPRWDGTPLVVAEALAWMPVRT